MIFTEPQSDTKNIPSTSDPNATRKTTQRRDYEAGEIMRMRMRMRIRCYSESSDIATLALSFLSNARRRTRMHMPTKVKVDLSQSQSQSESESESGRQTGGSSAMWDRIPIYLGEVGRQNMK